MAQLAPQKIKPAGTAVALVAASAGGDTFPAGSRTALRVKNGSGAGITVTVHAQHACNHGTLHDLAVVVAAGATEEIGGLDPRRFADADGLIHVTYSATATVTVGVVR